MNTNDIKECRQRILDRICCEVEPEFISIEDDLALIAVVGRGMIKSKGTAARLFNACAAADINIRMIDQGSCELNIIIGVDANDFARALNAIYKEFVG
jgi:aspartate kinase